MIYLPSLQSGEIWDGSGWRDDPIVQNIRSEDNAAKLSFDIRKTGWMNDYKEDMSAFRCRSK